MRLSHFAAVALALAGGGAGAAEQKLDNGAVESGYDYHSYANTDQFRVTHLDIDIRVFSRFKNLDCVVGLEVKRLDPRATQLVLDTKGLMVNDVSEKATDVIGATTKGESTWVSRPFHLEKPDPILGSALVIELPPARKAGGTEVIKIEYETTDASTALQWVDAGQNTQFKRPFRDTQSEAIEARSWLPLQDTPQVRVTYEAKIHTDPDVRAVMSAENNPKIEHRGEFRFHMPQAIPSYLIALAVGPLEYKEIGPRTGVYADKHTIKAAAKEFADTEAMLEATEKMFGPYRWSRYDILVMPASFPMGGEENPRLSFITPTIIAGDKSLVSVIAHELAHSWAGNLVGNATWRDLWLNEGFSDYMESRIIAAVYGPQRAAMEEVLGLERLRANLATLQPADQLLAIDLRDRDPEEVFSDVPYEKGRLFLNFLDAKFGREHFDVFLRGYFDHFAFKSITTEQFEQYLEENLLTKYPGIVTSSEVDQWLHGPGLPAFAVLPTTTMFQPVDDARAAFLSGSLPAKKFGAGWVTQQWQYFLNHMPGPLSAAQMTALDQAYGFTKSNNSEIACSWFSLAIANDYRPAFAALEQYLHSVGRIKLVLPLYQQLMKTDAGAEVAKRAYIKARPNYHPRAQAAVDAVVDVSNEPSE